MKFIQYEEVINQLSFSEAIQVMKGCFHDYEKGQISQSERRVECLPDGSAQNIFAMMPAYLGSKRFFGAKMITAFPGNRTQGLPSHQGVILLFESANGYPVATIDANAVTWIRTAAVSALATDYLAKADAMNLTLIGAGQQASSHLAAIHSVRKLKRVFVYDLDQDRSQAFVAQMQQTYPELKFFHCSTVEAAVCDSEIICTLTSSKEAFLKGEWIAPGTHINAVGTFTPTTRELTSHLMESSRIYVDDYGAALRESGDLLLPIQEGVITAEAIKGTLGELVTEKTVGRSSDSEITVFDAVGLAIEDLCCAEYLFQKIGGR